MHPGASQGAAALGVIKNEEFLMVLGILTFWEFSYLNYYSGNFHFLPVFNFWEFLIFMLYFHSGNLHSTSFHSTVNGTLKYDRIERQITLTSVCIKRLSLYHRVTK
jgi:hypothetical protein